MRKLHGWPKCVGKLGWFKWVGMLGWLELACPTACACLFKLRPGALSKTLSLVRGKLNLPIFLFSVGLFTLINIDSTRTIGFSHLEVLARESFQSVLY